MGIDCDFCATGDTAEEVMMKGSEHATVTHPTEMAGMKAKMSDEEMKGAMMSAMKDV